MWVIAPSSSNKTRKRRYTGKSYRVRKPRGQCGIGREKYATKR